MRLSADEIKLVVFVLLALLVGAAVKHYRISQSMPLLPAAAQITPAQASSIDDE